MRFLVDSMLGKLVRWLRMLGNDTAYNNDLSDDKLIELAAKERRILLTCDLQLYNRASNKGIKSFLIKGVTDAQKLAELARKFGIRLKIDGDNSHCPKCNMKLNSILKKEVINKVPHSTSGFYDSYWICSNCSQIYWQGSHWKKIKQKLLEAETLAKLS